MCPITDPIALISSLRKVVKTHWITINLTIIVLEKNKSAQDVIYMLTSYIYDSLKRSEKALNTVIHFMYIINSIGRDTAHDLKAT